MPELIFRKDGVVYRDVVETPLGQEYIEKKAEYERIKVLKLSGVSVEPIINDGVLKAIRMVVDKVELVNEEEKQRVNGKSKLAEKIEKRLKEKDWPEYVVNYAHAMLNPKTLASTIRRIIKEKKKISDMELRELVRSSGYNPSSGSYTAILRVLDEFLGDVERVGRGKNKVYVWVGEDEEE